LADKEPTTTGRTNLIIFVFPRLWGHSSALSYDETDAEHWVYNILKPSEMVKRPPRHVFRMGAFFLANGPENLAGS
jgi:hypothetical protein